MSDHVLDYSTTGWNHKSHTMITTQQ